MRLFKVANVVAVHFATGIALSALSAASGASGLGFPKPGDEAAKTIRADFKALPPACEEVEITLRGTLLAANIAGAKAEVEQVRQQAYNSKGEKVYRVKPRLANAGVAALMLKVAHEPGYIGGAAFCTVGETGRWNMFDHETLHVWGIPADELANECIVLRLDFAPGALDAM